eukprot:6332633-Pyramimonas_sp.AAC.1
MPYHYLPFFSAGPNPGSGGLAFLVPWFSEAELRSIDPHLLPSTSLKILVPGRVAELSISNVNTDEHVRILNIHNYDVPHGSFASIKSCWMDGARWAQEDDRHRIFIAIGDFNIADIEPLSLEQPTAARLPQAQGAPPRSSPRAASSSSSCSSSSTSSSTAPRERARRAGNSRSVWHRGNQGQGFWRALFQQSLAEVTCELPTHFSKQHQTCSFIDRAFISLKSHSILNTA